MTEAQNNSPYRETPSSSGYFRLKLVFEERFIETLEEQETKREELRDGFREFFSPDKVNIFMDEFAGQTPEDHETMARTLAEKYAEFGSFSKATLYADIALKAGDPEVDDVLSRFDFFYQHRDKLNSPQSRYRFAIHDALDDLVSEGYPIQLVIEPPFEGDFLEIKELKQGLTDEYITNTLNTFVQQLHARDANIARFIKEVAKTAEATSTSTNLLIYLGTYHLKLLEELPEEIKTVATVEKAESPVLNYKKSKRIRIKNIFKSRGKK